MWAGGSWQQVPAAAGQHLACGVSTGVGLAAACGNRCSPSVRPAFHDPAVQAHVLPCRYVAKPGRIQWLGRSNEAEGMQTTVQ